MSAIFILVWMCFFIVPIIKAVNRNNGGNASPQRNEKVVIKQSDFSNSSEDEDDEVGDIVFGAKTSDGLRHSNSFTVKKHNKGLVTESRNALLNQMEENIHLNRNKKSVNSYSSLSRETGKLSHSKLSQESRDDEKEWFK